MECFFSALEPLLCTTELSLLFTGKAKSSESNWKATTFKKYSEKVKNCVKGYNDDACQKHTALINNFRDILGINLSWIIHYLKLLTHCQKPLPIVFLFSTV